MALHTSSTQLFGLDLAPAWQTVRGAWRHWYRWPILRLLAPTATTVLVQADGHLSLWTQEGRLRTTSEPNLTSARFVAIEVPDALVLRRDLALPAALPEEEIAHAAEMEASGASPFPPEDLAWGYRLGGSATAGRRHVCLALVSRRQMEAYRAGLPLPPPRHPPEVWASVENTGPIVLSGYGEARRHEYIRRWRRAAVGLVLLALAIAGAIAVTPTVQLAMRAVEAAKAFETLRARTAPLTQQREALVQTNEKLRTVAQLLEKQPQPLVALDRLTRMLSDDTWLQGLRIQGHQISISGQTTDSAALMQELGRQEGVQAVRAPSPATRGLGATKEFFTIDFTLEPSVPARQTGAPGAAGNVLTTTAPAPSSVAASAPRPPSSNGDIAPSPMATPMPAPAPTVTAPPPPPSAPPPRPPQESAAGKQPPSASPFGMVGSGSQKPATPPTAP